MKEGHYTLAGALDWTEDKRIELIEGKAVMMARPLRVHQEVLGAISVQISNYLQGKRSEVYMGPFFVRPFEKDGDKPEDVDTMLAPDITVVCGPDI